MWERFSYYGMRAILVLYLVDALRWDAARATGLYGTYTMLVYLTPLAGGWLADRLLGTRRSLVLGGVLIAAGHFSLAAPGMAAFRAGLGLIIAGTGFFKPSTATTVGQMYRADDPRRDAGFTVYYMGINAGALLGPLVCGWLAQRPRFGWHWGFAAAGLGMVLGLALYLWGRDRWLPGIGERPEGAPVRAAAPGAAVARQDERRRIVALLVTAGFVVFFWAAYEQAGSSMTLFADRYTDLDLAGFRVPSSWFQSLNPLLILVLAPAFAVLWGALGRRRLEPSTPVKMVLGLVLLGIGFVVLAAGGRRADAGVRVSPLWLCAAYLFDTLGELCLSPVGLSYVSRIAPPRFASLLMGAWFLANAAANKIAGALAAYTPLPGEARDVTEAGLGGLLRRVSATNAGFYSIFVVSSFAGAGVMLLFVPLLRRLARGAEAGAQRIA